MGTAASEGEGVVASNWDLGEAIGVIIGIILLVVVLRMGTGIVSTCCDQPTAAFALKEGNMGVGKHRGLAYPNVNEC